MDPSLLTAAMPELSYPRYSRRFKASTNIGAASCLPKMPIIPHIFLPQWVPLFFLLRRIFLSFFAPLLLFFCLEREIAKSSAGISFVITEPLPVIELFPTVTGAMSIVFDPINTSSPITVRCLVTPS